MTKYLKWGIVAAAILVASLLSLKACDIYQSRGVLLGELNMLKAQAKMIDAKAKREIAAQGAIILAKDTQISALTTAVGQANNTIGVLEGEYATLDEAYRKAATCPEKLAISLTQIDNLKRNVAVLVGIVADKDKIILAWNDKFDAQVAISLSWKNMHDVDHATVDKQGDLVKNLNTSLRISRLTGSVKSVAIIAASVYILTKVTGVLK